MTFCSKARSQVQKVWFTFGDHSDSEFRRIILGVFSKKFALSSISSFHLNLLQEVSKCSTHITVLGNFSLRSSFIQNSFFNLNKNEKNLKESHSRFSPFASLSLKLWGKSLRFSKSFRKVKLFANRVLIPNFGFQNNLTAKEGCLKSRSLQQNLYCKFGH